MCVRVYGGAFQQDKACQRGNTGKREQAVAGWEGNAVKGTSVDLSREAQTCKGEDGTLSSQLE